MDGPIEDTVSNLSNGWFVSVSTAEVVWDSCIGSEESMAGETVTPETDGDYSGYVVSVHHLPDSSVVIQWDHGMGISSVSLHQPDEKFFGEPAIHYEKENAMTENVYEAVKTCFRNARMGKAHCSFGEPLNDDQATRAWYMNFPGDFITLAGATFPISSNVVACPEHDKLLQEKFGNTEVTQ